MEVSENRGPQYSTLNSRILIIGTPKQGTPLFPETPILIDVDPVVWAYSGRPRCLASTLGR